ncbi:MAG TPA: FKBP-type peptidyl-prolyl cis-trans isomerase [Solirubrobacteraceae bacterium]
MTRRRLALACLLIAPVLSACGSDSSNQKDEAAATPTPTSTATATPAPTKPKVKVPSGKPPNRLVMRDLRVGTGLPARAGQTVSVQYVGVNYKNGKQFDASWDRGQPFSFTLGAGQVIPGWDKGVLGMRPGGRRELIIPPSLGYGPQGQPPVIKPNETLLFVIDLISVQ